ISSDSPLLGVNTPRSDEDRLKLMELMFFWLQKVNPHIYISCIKQFWNTASVKRSDDVTRLQALVDRKNIVLSEDVIREILQLDEAEGVNQVGDLSTHAIRYISPALTQKVFANMRWVGKENVAKDVANAVIPSPPSHDIPSPSQEPSSTPQQPQSSPQAPPQGVEFPTHIQQVLDRLEMANKVKSSKLRRLRKVEASKRIESSDDMEDVFNQGRMIDDLDKDEGIELVKDVDVAETEGRHAAEQAKKQAEIYHLDMDHPSKVLIVVAYIRRRKGVIIKDSEEELSSKTPTETSKLKDKGKGILIETPKPMKKKDQIEQDAEYAKKLH
nr:hypothetical protein [Tanacetum cinerariifolium]